MARVVVPPLMRDLTAGQATVRACGRTVAEVINALEGAYPGFAQRLIVGGQLVAGISVAVDGHHAMLELRAPVREESEIRFLPLLGGG